MKRIDGHARNRWTRVSVRRWRRNCLKIRKRRKSAAGRPLESLDLIELRRRRLILPKPVYEQGTWQSPWGLRREIRLLAPENLNLGSSFEQTMSFVEEMRHAVFVERRFYRVQRRTRQPRLIIDLSPVSSMSIDAALVIAAEFDRIKRVQNFRPTIIDARWKPSIKEAWRRLGLYDLVDATNTPETVVPESQPFQLRFVRFISGKQVEGPLANELLDRLVEALGQTPSDMGLYGGIVEAIANVRSHAYSLIGMRRAIPQINAWWAGGAFDPIAGRLHVSVYDQGLGIPTTLAARPWFPELLRLTTEHSDAKKIQLALEYGETSTNIRGRGNGLWQIAEIARKVPNSAVDIVSGSGRVHVAQGGTQKYVLSAPFCGTLIHWDLDVGRHLVPRT